MRRVTDDVFAALWDAAGSLAEVVEAVAARLGLRVPKWSVLARAHALRREGVPLPPKSDEAPPVSPLDRAKRLATQLMAQHHLSEWQFGFNSNKRRAGVCRYPTKSRQGRIELSKHFVLHNPEHEVLDTILHEIAHALVGPGHGHDEVWKAKCVEIGARPERCYGEAVVMPKGRWRATCGGCGTEHDRHRKPKRLTGWHCRKCGKERGALRWVVAE